MKAKYFICGPSFMEYLYTKQCYQNVVFMHPLSYKLTYLALKGFYFSLSLPY